MLKYTDSHVHFGQRNNLDEKECCKNLISNIKKNNITKAFLFPIGIGFTYEVNLWMFNAIKDYLDYFILFSSLDPQLPEGLSSFKKLLNLGFRGLKLHPYGCKFRIDDFKLIDPFMNLCMEHNCHVIVHCTSNDEYCSPEQLELLAKRYPDITFQMAHIGAIWDCSKAIDIIDRNDNIYGDTSIASYSAIQRAVKRIPDKLLIGTDYPFYRFEQEQLKIQLACEDNESALIKITNKNFLNLIKNHNY